MTNKQGNIGVGGDSGGNSFKLAVTCGASPISQQEYKSSVTATPEEVSSQMIAAATEQLKGLNLGWEDVDAFGAGFPNPVGDGVILGKSNRESVLWHRCEIKNILAECAHRAGLPARAPVVAMNDTQCASRAAIDGLSPDERHRVIIVVIGTGVGTAVMFADKIPEGPLGGSEGGRAPFYHTPWGLDQLSLPLEYRCLEYSVSRTAIELLIKSKHLEKLACPIGDKLRHLITSRDLNLTENLVEVAGEVLKIASDDCDRADLQSLAMQIMQGQANVLGLKLADLCQWLQPTKILVGGGPMNEKRTSKIFRSWFLNSIYTSIQASVDTQFSLPVNLVDSAAHGDYAGAIGAARTALRLIA